MSSPDKIQEILGRLRGLVNQAAALAELASPEVREQIASVSGQVDALSESLAKPTPPLSSVPPPDDFCPAEGWDKFFDEHERSTK